mgnify:CR=1 FL=1
MTLVHQWATLLTCLATGAAAATAAAAAAATAVAASAGCAVDADTLPTAAVATAGADGSCLGSLPTWLIFSLL